MEILSIGIVSLGIFPGFFAKQISKVTKLYFSNVVYEKSMLFQLDTVTTNEVAILPLVLLLTFFIVIGLLTFVLWCWLGKSSFKKEEPWVCGGRVVAKMLCSGTFFSHPHLLLY